MEVQAFPRIVYKQTTAPAATAGAFWYKTDTTEFFYYDGSSWVEISTGAPATALLSIENALSILEIQAADTITPDTSAQIASDIFTEILGYNNTIDLTNTNSQFNENYFNNFLSSNNAHARTMGNNYGSKTTREGVKITATTNGKIYAIKKNSNTLATKAYIYDAAGTGLLGSADFSGNYAAFSTPISITNTTSYCVLVDAAGGAISCYNEHNGLTSTITETYCNYTDGVTANTTLNDNLNIIEEIFISSTNNNTIIQTSKIDLPSTPSKFIIFAFRDETTGTGSITADISFDNGANYQTGIPLNTETSITNIGDEMILKLNLNAGASAGTAEAQGYGVLFW